MFQHYKKYSLALGAFCISALLVACGAADGIIAPSDNNSSSSSQETNDPLSSSSGTNGSSSSSDSNASSSSQTSASATSDAGSITQLSVTEDIANFWSIQGLVSAKENILDVEIELLDAKSNPIEGAIYAFSVEMFQQANKPLTELNIGLEANNTPGLEAEFYTGDLYGQCGSMTVQVTAKLAQDQDTVSVTAQSEPFTIECEDINDDIIEDPFDDVDLIGFFDTTVVTIGGPGATLGSSFDIDAGIIYKSSELNFNTASSVDVIFNGTQLLTPAGAVLDGYLATQFANVNSFGFLIPVSKSELATVKTTNDLDRIIDLDNMGDDFAITNDSAFIVASSDSDLFILIVDKIDGTQNVQFRLLTMAQ
jgi:hypothetical protein